MTTVTETRRATNPAAPKPPARLLTRDYHWRDDATCATVDPELFYPTGPGGTAAQMERQAKSICDVCPVRAECLAEAIEAGDYTGIRGGLTEVERRGMVRGGQTAFLRCLEAQEYIEAQIAAKVPRRDVAAEMGVSYEIVRRAVDFFKAERQELTA
ncbi:WhiB family transcriptional regulator [Streptomyces sp. NPDC093509]|uniref:WhiB family transcriptional regulator n=1 Tax=Streptomyces sp. NPDC093509 TaxID=3154982 RepID=UPI0034507A9E